jgi:hypothetical protein
MNGGREPARSTFITRLLKPRLISIETFDFSLAKAQRGKERKK